MILTDIKPRPNHSRHLADLRKMMPEQRIQKAFELSAFTRQLFYTGLRKRFLTSPSRNCDKRRHRRRLPAARKSPTIATTAPTGSGTVPSGTPAADAELNGLNAAAVLPKLTSRY